MQARALLVAMLVLLPACADHPDPLAPDPTHPGAQPLIVGPEVTFTEVGANSSFTCALRSDGAVECWGDNTGFRAPALVEATSGAFVHLSSRYSQTCALRDDGVAECWGANIAPNGEIGGREIRAATTGAFVKLSVGLEGRCGLRDDAAIECWSYGSGESVVFEALAGSYADVSAGDEVCGLKADRTVECWSGRTRDLVSIAFPGFTQFVSGHEYRCWLSGLIQCVGESGEPAAVTDFAPATGSFTRFDTQVSHGCALRTDGAIQCWGSNIYGQAPALVTAATGHFTQVSAGGGHSCALRNDGAVECRGNNESGQAPAVRFATRERALPTATFSAPASVIAGHPIPLALTGAQVPGYPSATTFTYAFDCGTGSGYAAASGTASASCPTSAAGTRTVRGKVIDQDGDERAYQASVTVKSAQEATTDLRTAVSTAGLAPDIRRGLTSKLDAALKAIAQGRTAVACTALDDFMNQVRAQRGKAIPAATADAWLVTAGQLRTSIGC